MHQPPWLSENDVDRAVDVRDAIPAVAAAIEHEARGLAGNIAKTMTTWDPASAAHALGGFDHATARVAFKTWVNTPVGAESLLSLFDATNGRILALMQSVTLGVIRTAAVSGVATDLLADPGADELAIIGSGRQALRQVAAVAAVRPLRRVRVWSPTPASRAGFAEQISAELGIVAEALPSLEAAVADAPIVTVVTRARAVLPARNPCAWRAPERDRRHPSARGGIRQCATCRFLDHGGGQPRERASRVARAHRVLRRRLLAGADPRRSHDRCRCSAVVARIDRL